MGRDAFRDGFFDFFYAADGLHVEQGSFVQVGTTTVTGGEGEVGIEGELTEGGHGIVVDSDSTLVLSGVGQEIRGGRGAVGDSGSGPDGYGLRNSGTVRSSGVVIDRVWDSGSIEYPDPADPVLYVRSGTSGAGQRLRVYGPPGAWARLLVGRAPALTSFGDNWTPLMVQAEIVVFMGVIGPKGRLDYDLGVGLPARRGGSIVLQASITGSGTALSNSVVQ